MNYSRRLDDQIKHEQEESEIINEKFIQLMKNKEAFPHQDNQQFETDQIQTISKRFRQLCHQPMMNYEQFRKGLGLMGREDSFISRIFNLIDEDCDGFITESNFLKYLQTILNGSEYEKARFGWMILTEGKSELELKDFMELFQEISVVWNALTGEIIIPKKKYVQELFNTFDVDQDQSITFNDYRLFFNQHLVLFGWFQYFNNIEIDQLASKNELQKVRDQLRAKLQLKPKNQRDQTVEEIRHNLTDSEHYIEKKLRTLTFNLKNQSLEIGKRWDLIQNHRQKSENECLMISSASTKSKVSLDESAVSLKSLYRYKKEDNIYSDQISLMKKRKEQQDGEQRGTFKIEVMKQLTTLMNQTYGLMELCHSHRLIQDSVKKYSPTKLKQMEMKLNLYDLNNRNQQLKSRLSQQSNSSQQKKNRMRVYFGHQNWNLVLNIMVGLRKSIKALYELNSVMELKAQHFTEQHEFLLGNKSLNGKSFQVFKFFEIGPLIFERIRHSYGISNIEYQKSVGPETLLNHLLTGNLTALNEKCSTGKSGAFFYLTLDNKIFLKTIPKHEFEFFQKILQNYYEYVSKNPNTLIVRIYGLYKLKIYENKKKMNTIYFVSMENIFSSVAQAPHLEIVETYDLKGSLYGRTGSQLDELKDQDWKVKKKKIRLDQEMKDFFKEQIKSDSRFFKKNNINDYSLMVVIVQYQGSAPPTNSKQPNLFKQCAGGVISNEKGLIYILTIIDILTAFEAKKNLEYIFKTTFLSKDVSCVPPQEYCNRFRQFMYQAVEEEN